MSYSAKTDWKENDIVNPEDVNRWETGIKEAHDSVAQSISTSKMGIANGVATTNSDNKVEQTALLADRAWLASVALSADTATNATEHISDTNNPHQTTAKQVGAINPNLLINGDFKIWQRGTGFTRIGIDKYLADRWKFNTSENGETVTVSKVDDGAKVNMGNAPILVLIYTFEDVDWEKLEGKTVTLSYSIDNEIKTKTFTLEYDSYYPNSLNFFVDYGNKTEFTINWVKLELGSTATPFSPRPYAEELAMCQRYYLNGKELPAFGYVSTATTAFVYLPTPTTMRNPFSIKSLADDDDSFGLILCSGKRGGITSINATFKAGDNYVGANVNITGHDGRDFSGYIDHAFIVSSQGNFSIDAEIY